jgi:murein DD-endopeptidase MepM/ murein hydrolase activator NlpD
MRRRSAPLVLALVVLLGGVASPVAGGVAQPPAAAIAVPEALRASLAWPVPRAAVLGAFAAPSTRWGAGHRGIDVAAVPGEVVVAATAGTVTFSGVVVDRPVVTVRMAGVPQEVLVTVEPVRPSVAEGDVVDRGQAIGVLEAGHRPCGACIHLGVRIDGAYANPMALLGAERAVLLPLDGGADGR